MLRVPRLSQTFGFFHPHDFLSKRWTCSTLALPYVDYLVAEFRLFTSKLISARNARRPDVHQNSGFWLRSFGEY